MKKILLLIVSIILLSSTFSFKLTLNDVFDGENAIYTFYTTGEYNIKNAKVIKNGCSTVVRTGKQNAKNVRKQLSCIMGESVCFEGDLLKFSQIKDSLDASLIIDETIENEIIIFSGYSEKMKNILKNISIDGQTVNFQMAYNKGVITIGTPVILGDY